MNAAKPPDQTMLPSVDLHIEELLLHGFPPCDRDRIGAAVQRGLARLLAERGVPQPLHQGGEVARLDGGSFQIAPHLTADAIGAQVAQAVGRALNL